MMLRDMLRGLCEQYVNTQCLRGMFFWRVVGFVHHSNSGVLTSSVLLVWNHQQLTRPGVLSVRYRRCICGMPDRKAFVCCAAGVRGLITVIRRRSR